jgi:hypothetical protein
MGLACVAAKRLRRLITVALIFTALILTTLMLSNPSLWNGALEPCFGTNAVWNQCCATQRFSYPALGREYRIRSFVPNISSIIRICKPIFEHPDEFLADTLEQVFVLGP